MKTIGVLVIASLASVVASACGSWALELAGRGVSSVDQAVALGAAGLAAALGAWYGMTAVALVLLHVAGESRHRAVVALRTVAGALGAPVLRRAAAAGVGAGLLLGMSPALADSDAPPGHSAAVESAGDEYEVPVDLRPGFLSGPEGATIPASDEQPSAGGPVEHRPPPTAPADNDQFPAETDPSSTPTAEPAPGAPSTAVDSQTGPRPAGRTATTSVGIPASTAPETEEYVVRPGDSLWSIAAEHLGGSATDAQIAAAWPRWHTVNRAVVGADPNLIHPGQELVAPDQEDA